MRKGATDAPHTIADRTNHWTDVRRTYTNSVHETRCKQSHHLHESIRIFFVEGPCFAPENEDVGQIKVFVISDHPARFWEVQFGFMHTNHPEEPRGLIPGARC